MAPTLNVYESFMTAGVHCTARCRVCNVVCSLGMYMVQRACSPVIQKLGSPVLTNDIDLC